MRRATTDQCLARNLSRVLVVAAALVCAIALGGCHEDEERTPLVFAPDTLGKGALGVPYTATITVYQHLSPVGEISITSGSLPPGLVLEHLPGDNHAIITGTPTQAGTYRFRLGAWCSADELPRQQQERAYTVVVDW